ncbi:MAG: hypothetical protein MUP60_03695, partial [Candidatus Thorarchaeota archaeon]|nr:hypothetical protein [Candidatus Thorarchaeota archaeon]
PLVDEGFGAKQAETMDELLKVSDIIVLCVGHDQIVKELAGQDLTEKVFIDPRNLMPKMKGNVKKYVGLSV